MMDKNGKQGIACIYCQKDALPDTDPPVCEEHLLMEKKAAEAEPKTLKELDNAE